MHRRVAQLPVFGLAPDELERPLAPQVGRRDDVIAAQRRGQDRVGDLLVVVTTMFFDWQVDYQTKLSPDGGDPPDLCGLEETKSIADLSVIEYNWPSGWTSRLVNRWQFQQSLVSGDPWWEYRVYTHTRLATHAGEHTYTGWTLEPWSAMGSTYNADVAAWVFRGESDISTTSARYTPGSTLDLNSVLSLPPSACNVLVMFNASNAFPTDTDPGTFGGYAGLDNWGVAYGSMTATRTDFDGTAREFPALYSDGVAQSIVAGFSVGPRGGGLHRARRIGHPIGAGYSGAIVAR